MPVDVNPTTLAEIILAKQTELEKHNDKIANYEDMNWIMERKQKLVDKREIMEQQLAILLAAQKQLHPEE